jgi:nucleotidyltransferase substrate binding protein (TIGR01987 family)
MSSENLVLTRLQERITTLTGSLIRLQELKNYPEPSDLEKTAFVQRFNLTFELSWKVLRDILEYEGLESEAIKSPRETIRTGVKSEILKDGEIWFSMIDNRNIIAHEYDETKTLVIFEQIKGQYLGVLEDFYNLVCLRYAKTA